MTEVDWDTIDPAERYRHTVRVRGEARKEFALSKNRCDACMLKQHICVCAKLSELITVSSTVDVAILMNHREQYRASNTAKIIHQVLGARIYIDGVDRDMEDLVLLIEERKSNAVVLFPSEDSSTWPTVNEQTKGKKPLVIVLDGTWRQARRLNKKIPECISRVKITPQTLSQFLCRRQTQADRVCTVEALALLMTETGDVSTAERLEEGLRLVVEGFNMQCYNTGLRPVAMLKQTPKGDVLPPRHPASLVQY
jgi:DTW domain-containing protein